MFKSAISNRAVAEFADLRCFSPRYLCLCGENSLPIIDV
jgi:hypothetical protein